MTFKEKKELQSMDAKHLQEELVKAKQYLAGISFDHRQGNLKNTNQLKMTKAYIAAIKTFNSHRKKEAKIEAKQS